MNIQSVILILSLSFSIAARSDNQSQAELGKHLFFDKRLSKNNSVSCQSCHNISVGNLKALSGADVTPVSYGVYGRRGNRNTPTVWNASQRESLFWDGRAKSLQEQAYGPILHHDEMGMNNMSEVSEKLSKVKGYKKLFEKAFGTSEINGERIVNAIAEFEKGLLAKNSPFDRFLSGDANALNEQARRGWDKFRNYSCIACHGAATFLDQDYFVRFPMHSGTDEEKKYDIKADKGRFESTKSHFDMHRWRVPSLRNVELTGPYLHNGSVSELSEVVRVMGRVQLNRQLSESDVADIVEFLNSLTGDIKPIKPPKEL